jgi:hypothetical protein
LTHCIEKLLDPLARPSAVSLYSGQSPKFINRLPVYLISSNSFQSLNLPFKDIVQKIFRPNHYWYQGIWVSWIVIVQKNNMSFFLSKSFRIPNRNLPLAGFPRNRSPVRALPAVSRAPRSSMGSRNTSIDHGSFLPQFCHTLASGVALGLVCQL